MLNSLTLSFVATSRNDDHGGDVLRRTQSFIRSLARQAERHQLHSELVMVDWNPPQSRAPLATVLDWPAESEWFSAKVVTVPHDVHLALPNARSLAMFQMIAKNVGLRRAIGDFSIATNIDIIFSDELFEWLKTSRLDVNTVYRSDRWDIPNDIQLEPDFDRLLQRAREEAIRKQRREGTFERRDGRWIAPCERRVDFMLLQAIEGELGHLRERLRRGEAVTEAQISHVTDHVIPMMRRYYLTPNIHSHGCGDFTMLSRSGWERIRGYPEWPIFSWNIDTVSVVHAVMQGMDYVEAPADAVHYHIEHDNGSGFTPEGAGSLWRRLKERSVQYLSDMRELLLEMDEEARQERPIEFNAESWGFSEVDLPTRCVTSAAGPTPAVARNVGKLVERFDSTGLDGFAIDARDAVVIENSWATPYPWSGRQAQRFVGSSGAYNYLLQWTPPAMPKGKPYWLRFFCRIEKGPVSFALLNANGDGYVAELELAQGDAWREIVIRAPPMEHDPQLVLRNLETGSTRGAISSIDVFWGDEIAYREPEALVCQVG